MRGPCLLLLLQEDLQVRPSGRRRRGPLSLAWLPNGHDRPENERSSELGASSQTDRATAARAALGPEAAGDHDGTKGDDRGTELHDLSVEVRPDGVRVVLGPNGGRKS